MAVTLVQKSSGASGTGVSITTNAYPGSTTSGNLLIPWIGSNDGSCTNPTGCTTIIDCYDTTDDDFIRAVGKIADGSETTFQFTALAGNSHCVGSLEYTGNDTSSVANAIDKTAVTTESAGVTSKTSGTTAATTVANDMSVAFWHVRANISAVSYTNSFNEQYALFLATSNRVADHQESATGTKESTMSWTTAGNAVSGILVIKGASGGGGIVYPQLERGIRGHVRGSYSERY